MSITGAKKAVTICALGALAALVSGCSVTGPSGMSQDEVEALVQQIAGPASNAMSGMAAASALPASGLSRAPSVLVNVPFSARTNCTAGGNIQVTGSMTGSIDQNGSGVLSLEANETISDWQCVGAYVFNGDPYISLTGTFSFFNGNLNSPASMNMGGGFKWGTGSAQSCQINLTFLIYADGSGRVSGSVCNRTVNISVS